MTFDTFSQLLAELKPGAVAYPHGALAYTDNRTRRHSQTVGIAFTEGGKVYEYRGTYTDILKRFGGGPKFAVWSEVCHGGEFWTMEDALIGLAEAQARDDALVAQGWDSKPQTYAIHTIR